MIYAYVDYDIKGFVCIKGSLPLPQSKASQDHVSSQDSLIQPGGDMQQKMTYWLGHPNRPTSLPTSTLHISPLTNSSIKKHILGPDPCAPCSSWTLGDVLSHDTRRLQREHPS